MPKPKNIQKRVPIIKLTTPTKVTRANIVCNRLKAVIFDFKKVFNNKEIDIIKKYIDEIKNDVIYKNIDYDQIEIINKFYNKIYTEIICKRYLPEEASKIIEKILKRDSLRKEHFI